MTNINFQQKFLINYLFLSKVLTPNQMERFVTLMEENINAKKTKNKKEKANMSMETKFKWPKLIKWKEIYNIYLYISVTL